MKSYKYNFRIFSLLFLGLLFLVGCSTNKSYKAVIITGQNNHNWELSSQNLEKILDQSGVFEVDVITAPSSGSDMQSFNPSFSDYDVVVLDYNGDDWTQKTQKSFEQYVKDGGGVVVYHAANNAFPKWKAYNQITGLGGWGDRDETSGPYVYWKDGGVVKDPNSGKGGSHGKQVPFVITQRDTLHPICKGLPARWYHVNDELYSNLRGPAENITVLATAWSDPKTGGSGKEEPVLFTVSYGKGRVFHTVLGHSGKEGAPAMHDAGFIVTFQRGAEWAASGQVTQTISGDFPGRWEAVIWPTFRPLTMEELVVNMRKYKKGKPRRYWGSFEACMRQAHREEKDLVPYEKALINLLEGDATADACNQACQLLSVFGSEACVSTLNELSKKEETKDMARFALDRIQS